MVPSLLYWLLVTLSAEYEATAVPEAHYMVLIKIYGKNDISSWYSAFFSTAVPSYSVDKVTNSQQSKLGTTV